jgi:hypothetical protein
VEEVPEKAIFRSVTVIEYNRIENFILSRVYSATLQHKLCRAFCSNTNVSSQCNLLTLIEQVQDKLFFKRGV